METEWIQKIDSDNFLAVYDVLLDIQKEQNILSEQLIIPLLPQIVRFQQLFPGDGIGMRDRYCDLRWKATNFLKTKSIILDFELIDGYHRWENQLAINARPSDIEGIFKIDEFRVSTAYSSKEV